jgi:hypothetical protein
MKEHIELLVHLYDWYQNKYCTDITEINTMKENRATIVEYLIKDNFPVWMEWNGDRLKREWLENNGKTY